MYDQTGGQSRKTYNRASSMFPFIRKPNVGVELATFKIKAGGKR
jgi:hypothetical protein